MTIKYVLSDTPLFVFDARLVPADFFISYGYESEMFAYLNSHLLPSDIDKVVFETDGVNGYVAIIYEVDEETLENMPPFERLDDDVCPF